MKVLIMLKMFYSRMKGISITLGVIMSFAIFMVCLMQGNYDYSMKDIRYINKIVGNADLYMQFISWRDNQKTVDLIDELNKIKGINKVYYNVTVYMEDTNRSYVISYCPKEVITDIFNCQLEDSNMECISTYSDILEGQKLNLVRCNTDIHYEINVKKAYTNEFKYLSYGTSGSVSVLTVDNLLRSKETLFIPVENIKDIMIDDISLANINCYVLYDDNLTNEQKENIRESVSSNFTCIPMSRVISNTKEVVNETIERRLYIPRIAICIVTFACCVVTLLVITQKMKEYAIYYLCGCSKFRLLSICIIGISLLIVIPVILNLLIIIYYEKYISYYINFGEVLFSTRQVLISLGFLVVTAGLSGIIEAIMIAKMSPLELYRRMTR